MPRESGRWCGNKSVSLEVQRTVTYGAVEIDWAGRN